MTKVNFLDLDAVASTVDFTIKIKGVEYKVEESSVDDFIANAKAVENMGMSASPADELELILSVLKRALPSCEEGVLRGLKLSQLNRIREFVMTANGELGEEVPKGEAPIGSENPEGNVQPVS